MVCKANIQHWSKSFAAKFKIVYCYYWKYIMECKSLFCWKIAFLECTLSYLRNLFCGSKNWNPPLSATLNVLLMMWLTYLLRYLEKKVDYLWRHRVVSNLFFIFNNEFHVLDVTRLIWHKDIKLSWICWSLAIAIKNNRFQCCLSTAC